MSDRPRIRPARWAIYLLLAAIPLAAWFSRGALLGLSESGDDGEILFSVPQQRQRLAAIGATAELPPPLQRAFDPAENFEPIPPPQRSDWLAQHIETGQTFEQFTLDASHRPDTERNRLYILPLGEFLLGQTPSLDDLRICAEAFFQLDVKVLPALPLEDLKLTQRRHAKTGRRQFLTDDLLDVLRAQLPPDAYCLLGLTREDLYPREDWNFVFGLASLDDHVGVFSLARYDPTFHGAERTAEDDPLMMRRSCRILFHETGHMFGMKHCIFYACLMNGSNHLAEADRQPLHLCPVCLRKLHWSCGGDDFIPRRYADLEKAFEKVGLPAEAEWVRQRRAHVLQAPTGGVR